MTEQIVDIVEANMPASSDVVAEARAAGGAAGMFAGRRVADEIAESKVDRLGVGQVGMQNLGDDVKAALTGGKVAVVGDGSVAYPQFASAMRLSAGRLAQRVMNTRKINNQIWQVVDGKTSQRDEVGWTCRMQSASSGEVWRVRQNRTRGDLPGVIFADQDMKVLAMYCRGAAQAKTWNWQEVWCVAPANTAYIMFNTFTSTGFRLFADRMGADGPIGVERARDVLSDMDAVGDWMSGTVLADEWTPFTGNEEPLASRPGVSVETSGNQGVTTAWFESVASRVVVHYRGETTISTCAIQLAIVGSNGTKYRRLAELSPGVHDCTYVFDANSLTIYEGAQRFAVIVNNVGDNGGAIAVDGLTVAEIPVGGIRSHALYAPSLTDLLANVFAKMDSLEHGGNCSGQASLTSPNGSRYSIGVDDDGTLCSIPHIPQTMLVMGNSITLGLGGTFGMCATSQQADWCNRTIQAVRSVNTQVRVDKMNCAQFEQCESLDDATAWIQTNAARWTGKDLVVIQIGDNVNTDARRTVFAQSLPLLINSIHTASPHGRIIIVGIWFTSQLVADAIEATTRQGVLVTRIDDLNIAANCGVRGQTITMPNGSTITAQDNWITHPGDQGMRLIAERVIQTIDM